MSPSLSPLLTIEVCEALLAARTSATRTLECSLDLHRSTTTIEVAASGWSWNGREFPFLTGCKDRTIYHWKTDGFWPVARYTTSLVKLVPTRWGAPTFEIDGIKMLPTARVSPYADAERKVSLIQPRGKIVLDTCGGLGYFAAWCLREGAARVQSFESNADVIWLRSLNPWSPDSPWSFDTGSALTLSNADSALAIATLPAQSVDAILHDPPRFGTAGELYSQVFYHHLARVLKRGGKLFHYTGSPNKISSGRDLPNEVSIRLRHAGFSTRLVGDAVLAVKTANS